jgi:hypothetical protein
VPIEHQSSEDHARLAQVPGTIATSIGDRGLIFQSPDSSPEERGGCRETAALFRACISNPRSQSRACNSAIDLILVLTGLLPQIYVFMTWVATMEQTEGWCDFFHSFCITEQTS